MESISNKISDIREQMAAHRITAPSALSHPHQETRGIIFLLPLGEKREQPVSFQDLPEGIRKRIYELALENDVGVVVGVKHDPDGGYRASTGRRSLANRTSMALAQTCPQIRQELRLFGMKTISPAVSLFEHPRFLQDFVFSGTPLQATHIYLPGGKWPSFEVDLRPLVVARSENTNVIQLEGEYLLRLFQDWATWKTVLASGQLRGISFRSEGWRTFITFTLSRELGEVWQQWGEAGIGHDCPEMDILSNDFPGIYSCFKSEAWGDDVVVRYPVPLWKRVMMNGGFWDDRAHYGTL